MLLCVGYFADALRRMKLIAGKATMLQLSTTIISRDCCPGTVVHDVIQGKRMKNEKLLSLDRHLNVVEAFVRPNDSSSYVVGGICPV